MMHRKSICVSWIFSGKNDPLNVLSSPYLESPIPAPTVYTSRMASFTTAST